MLKNNQSTATPSYQSTARGLPPLTSPFAPGESLSESLPPPVVNKQCHFVAPGSSSTTPNTKPPISNPQAPLIDANNQKPNTASTIPAAAWPKISAILSEITFQSQNTMQTWDLGRALNDDTLEGVMLGIVYSSKSTKEGMNSASLELKVKIKGRSERSSEAGSKVEMVTDLNRASHVGERERWRRECVQAAVLEVESTRLLEGALDLLGDEQGNGGGRVSFLVYRVD